MNSYECLCNLVKQFPDYEAVGPVSLYFIAFAGLMTNFDHKNRVVKM